MKVTAETIIEKLGLLPHPEGGHFKEVFRSSREVRHPGLSGSDNLRSAMTSIYYLLEQGNFSAWHRVRSDEAWLHHAGAALELHLISPAGEYSVRLLGTDFNAGQAPQATVPAGWLQAARPVGEWALCGCVVAPGFDFADFDMPSRSALTRLFPQHAVVIAHFTR